MRGYLLICLLSFTIMIQAQDLKLCKWYNHKAAALVMTFDDWLQGHPQIVIPILDELELRGTFFVTTHNLQGRNDFERMRKAVLNGHEIGNHTVSHPALTALPFKAAKTEILDAQKLLTDSLPHNELLSFAYPMGTKTSEIMELLAEEKYIGARGVSPLNESAIIYPEAVDSRFFNVPTVRVWNIMTISKVNQWLSYAVKGGGMLNFMIHSVFDENIPKGWDAIPESYFQQFAQVVAARRSEFWITTFGQAMKYQKQYLSSSIHVVEKTAEKMSFVLTYSLEDPFKFHPMTIEYADINVKTIQMGDRILEEKWVGDKVYFEVPEANQLITLWF